MGQSFAGKTIYRPGVYSRSNVVTNSSAQAQTNIVAVVGKSLGGVPYNASGFSDEEKINTITGVADAINKLGGGDGYYMTEFFLSPTKEATLNRPDKVLFIRVDPATRASGIITASGPTNKIQLYSTRWGTLANRLTYKIVAGTNIGHKITAKYNGNIVGERDDIGYQFFTIEYTGAGSAATMTINATGLTTSCTGATGDNLSLTWAAYPTIGDLIAYINQTGVYTITLVGSLSDKSEYLDAVTAQDIKSAEYTAKALVQAIIDFFNNETGGEFEASLYPAATRTDVANMTNYAFLTGGSEGSAGNSDWSGAFELLEKINVNHILVASGDATIHEYARLHCESMSDVKKRRERTFGSGAVAGLTKAQKIAQIKAIGSYRAGYCISSPIRRDMVNGGATTTFAPFLGAALVAGIRYPNNVTISSTFKNLDVLGLGEYYNDTDIDDYIASGATIFGRAENGNGFSVIHELTTYQGTESLILNLPSMVRTVDYISQDIRLKLFERLAKLNNAPNAVQINELLNYITTNLLPGKVDEGVLTDDPTTGKKAFSDVQFTVVGDRFDLKYTGVVPAPLHFGFVDQYFMIVGQAN